MTKWEGVRVWVWWAKENIVNSVVGESRRPAPLRAWKTITIGWWFSNPSFRLKTTQRPRVDCCSSVCLSDWRAFQRSLCVCKAAAATAALIVKRGYRGGILAPSSRLRAIKTTLPRLVWWWGGRRIAAQGGIFPQKWRICSACTLGLALVSERFRIRIG